MAGFGVLALMQGFAMYRMQSQIQQQNMAIQNSARRDSSRRETREERKHTSSSEVLSDATEEDRPRISRKAKRLPFDHLAASPTPQAQPQSGNEMSETINKLLALQLMNSLKSQESYQDSYFGVRNRQNSIRTGSQDDIGLATSGASKSISRAQIFAETLSDNQEAF